MSNPSQQLLFEIHPIGTEQPIARRTITPGCLLPAPNNKFIDVARAGSILGVKKDVVHHLLASHQLRGYRLRESGPWNVEYASIAELCDRLRLDYHIADRRRAAPPSGRWRDDDLLPFPLADTVYTQDAMTGLGLTRVGAIRLCEEGAFECYRLVPNAGVPWRISKTSLFHYAERLRAALNQRPTHTKRR